jgi:3'-5' exonuclease
VRFSCIDIETIPNQAIPEECVPKFDEASVKTGNLKDPVKIREAIQKARDEFEAGIEKRMSLDPDLCQIVCVVGFDSETGFEEFRAPDSDCELTALAVAWDWIRERYNDRVPIVSFNGIGFDVPILARRAMIQDISVAPGMLSDLTRRQEYNTFHHDLMQLLAHRNAFSGKLETKSLEYYLRLFGIGSKTEGWDGSSVYPAWKDGRMDEIVAYCRQDVEMTAKLYLRVMPWLVHSKKRFEDLSAAAAA